MRFGYCAGAPATFVFVAGFFAAIDLALNRLTAFATDAEARAEALTTTFAELEASVTVLVAVDEGVVGSTTFGAVAITVVVGAGEVGVIEVGAVEVSVVEVGVVEVDVVVEEAVVLLGADAATSVDGAGSLVVVEVVLVVRVGSTVLISPAIGNSESSEGGATAKASLTNGFTAADMNCWCCS